MEISERKDCQPGRTHCDSFAICAQTFMRSDAVVRLLGDSLPFVVEGVATPGDIDALKWLGVSGHGPSRVER